MKKGLKEAVFKLCQKLAKQAALATGGSEVFELPIAVVAKRISSPDSYASALLAILIKEGRITRVESGTKGRPSKFRLGGTPVREITGADLFDPADDPAFVAVADGVD